MAIITLNNKAINRSDTASSGQRWTATSSTASDFQALPSGGKVLQIQSLLGGNDFSSTSTSFTDVSGMLLTITPSATNSKILLLCNTNLYQNTNQAYVAMRWERAISGGATTAFGHGTYGQSFARSAQAHDFWGGVGMTYLDSPSTTSAVTYKVQFLCENTTEVKINHDDNDGNGTTFFRATSEITVMEIQG